MCIFPILPLEWMIWRAATVESRRIARLDGLLFLVALLFDLRCPWQRSVFQKLKIRPHLAGAGWTLPWDLKDLMHQVSTPVFQDVQIQSLFFLRHEPSSSRLGFRFRLTGSRWTWPRWFAEFNATKQEKHKKPCNRRFWTGMMCVNVYMYIYIYIYT